MDGQRRVAEPISKNRYFRADCAVKYRVASRLFAMLFLFAALLKGVISGGHLEYAGSPWPKLPGQVASLFGLAAIDIEVSGLRQHEPAELLAQLSVKPGGPLIGFDAKRARAKLEELDWVDTATVMRRFPNQLHIAIVEREPFVVWQHEGKLVVVDQKGKEMDGMAVSRNNMLLHVVGQGANTAALSLVNQMEASPELLRGLKAAIRVGDRRWNLLMEDGVTIAMPSKSSEADYRTAESAYLRSIASKLAVAQIDFRVSGQVTYMARSLSAPQPADSTITSSIQ